MDLTAALITRDGIPVSMERNFLREMGGGCQTPLGALATLDGRQLTITAMVASPDGRLLLRQTITGMTGALFGIDKKLADNLRAQGADRLLADGRDEQMKPPVELNEHDMNITGEKPTMRKTVAELFWGLLSRSCGWHTPQSGRGNETRSTNG